MEYRVWDLSQGLIFYLSVYGIVAVCHIVVHIAFHHFHFELKCCCCFNYPQPEIFEENHCGILPLLTTSLTALLDVYLMLIVDFLLFVLYFVVPHIITKINIKNKVQYYRCSCLLLMLTSLSTPPLTWTSALPSQPLSRLSRP